MLDSAIRLNEPMTVEAFLAFCETVPRSERWELHRRRAHDDDGWHGRPFPDDHQLW